MLLSRILYSREILKSKIPFKVDNSILRDSVEAKELKNELETLNSFKEKLVALITFVFKTLNEDNVIPEMLSVLDKKILEESVFKDNIPKYDKLCIDVEKINSDIINCKKKILDKNNMFNNLKLKLLKPNEDNNKVSKSFK